MTPAAGGVDELLNDGLREGGLRSDERLLIQVLESQLLLPRLADFGVGDGDPP